MKLAKSGSLKRNLAAQVPDYAVTEKSTCVYVVIIQSIPKHTSDAFVKEIEQLVRQVGARRGLTYRVVWVDAQRKPSASKRLDSG